MVGSPAPRCHGGHFGGRRCQDGPYDDVICGQEIRVDVRSSERRYGCSGASAHQDVLDSFHGPPDLFTPSEQAKLKGRGITAFLHKALVPGTGDAMKKLKEMKSDGKDI